MPVTWNSDEIISSAAAAAMRGVVRGTEAVRTEMLRLILQTAKSGRVYELSNPRRTHQASAPGEAPASDLGNLVGSIYTSYDTSNLAGTVVIGAEYGARLEFGSPRVQPRPFARPALANMRSAIEDDIRDEVTEALR